MSESAARLFDHVLPHVPVRQWVLMQRAFEIDVLTCPWCSGRLRLIATVEDPREIREVLSALALSDEPVDRAPPLRYR